MAGYYANGMYVDPTQYKKSGFWDTAAGQKAASAQPYQGYLQKVGDASSAALKTVQGGAGKWGTGYPDIHDPTAMGYIKDYGDLIMSQQRNATDAYVNRAANTGVRGGFGAVGGPSQRSQLGSSALSTLAGGAADRARQGLDYAKGLYASGYASWKDAAALAESLLGLEKGALDSSTQYQMGITNAQRADYGSDVETAQQFSQQAPVQFRGYLDWQKQQAQQQAAREQQDTRDNLLRRVTTGYNYNTGWNANPDVPGVLAYLRATGTKF